MTPCPMFEIHRAGDVASSINITDAVIAISAFGALIVSIGALIGSIIIGIQQNRATHATVNRQIISKWIDDFRCTVSLISADFFVLHATQQKKPIDMLKVQSLLKNLIHKNSEMQLLLDVVEPSHKKFREILDHFRKSITKNEIYDAAEKSGKIYSEITTLSKVIVEQRMVLARAGELKESKESRSEIDSIFNSWVEYIESDKEESSQED